MFLDFLRVLSHYDRVAWNIQPIVLAHEVLIREGEMEAGELWRKEVGKRTVRRRRQPATALPAACRRSTGSSFPASSRGWASGSSNRWPSNDCVPCSNRRPTKLKIAGPGPAFASLDKEVQGWLSRSLGVGFEVPEWIQTLEDEIDRIVSHAPMPQGRLEPYPDVPQVAVAWDSLADEIRDSGIMP